MKKGTIAYINHEREQIKKGVIEAQEAFVNKFAEMNNVHITTIVTSFNELLTAVFSDKYDLMIIADYGALLDDENNVGLLVQFEKAGVKVCSTMGTLESNKSLYKKYLKAKKEMGDTPYSKEELKDLVKLFTAYDEIENVSLKKSEEQVDELTEANKNQLRAVIFYHPFLVGGELKDNQKSIDEQIEICKKFIHKNNWRLTKTVSTWVELLRMVGSKEIDILCFTDYRAFTKGMTDSALETHAICESEGVQVVAVNDKIENHSKLYRKYRDYKAMFSSAKRNGKLS